jgi:hypothetical protein
VDASVVSVLPAVVAVPAAVVGVATVVGADVSFVSSSLPHAAARSERATMPLSAIDRFLELFTL